MRLLSSVTAGAAGSMGRGILDIIMKDCSCPHTASLMNCSHAAEAAQLRTTAQRGSGRGIFWELMTESESDIRSDGHHPRDYLACEEWTTNGGETRGCINWESWS